MNPFWKTACGLFLAASCQLGAQEAPAPDLEARRAAQETLRVHIGMRERRLAELTAEITAITGRNDARIGELVTLLAGVRDSPETRRNVTRIKRQAIEGLNQMVQAYRKERLAIAEGFRRDGSRPIEVINREVDLVDVRIEKRVADILKLVESIPVRDDEAFAGYFFTTFWNGWYEYGRIAADRQQNRRDGRQATPVRREVRRALEDSIRELEGRRDLFTRNLAGTTLSAPAREIQQHELARVNVTLDQRRAQLLELTTPVLSPELTVTRNEARDLANLFNNARQDIATDFSKSLLLIREATEENDLIHRLRENFEARENWLKENKATQLPEEPEDAGAKEEAE